MPPLFLHFCLRSRDDIAAIEARNNSLDLQARNNGTLLGKLESLLALLELAPQTERLLLSGDFSIGSLGAIVNAGWDVHDHLEGLKVLPRPAERPCWISSLPSLFRMHCLPELGAVCAGKGSGHRRGTPRRDKQYESSDGTSK